MKMNKNFFSLVALILLSSCAAFHSRVPTDCSAAFEKGFKGDPNQSSECKIMPVKISKTISCEVSGSDKVDNILKVFGENKNVNKTMLIAPFKTLERSLSFKHRIYYYFAKQKVKSHIDSDLFKDLEDYEYKGFSCKIPAGTLTAWISEDDLIGSFEAK